MPHPPDAVQPKGPPRLIFVRQQFSPFGGGELILDRMMGALAKRGLQIALLARSWTGRDDVEFMRCDPPRSPRFLRERRFAEAACARLARERDAIVQAHERIPCCDVFRAGDGVHAAFLEARARGMGTLARMAQRFSPFHRTMLALEKKLFASLRLKAVIVNSAMVADEIVRHYAFPPDRIHLIANGIDLDRFSPAARTEHRATIRRQLDVPPERPVALFLGSGYGRKGLGGAIAALARSQTNAELWVVGRDRRPATYATQAARAGLGDRIPPDRSGARSPALLRRRRHPAVARGLRPVSVDRHRGARLRPAGGDEHELRWAGRGGEVLDSLLLRDAFDVEGLAEAIDRAFALAAKPATVAAARALVSEYGLEPMIERLLALYDELMIERG